MSEIKRIDTKTLATALRGLKDLAKNDYKEVLRQLHYNGPSFKTPKQFDAFLLEVVYECFDTIDTDYILISLGLLLGFEREIKIGKRYEEYLRYSNYIQDVYSGNCKEPYDSVDKEQKNRYKAALRDLADGRIEKLAEALAEIKMQEEFEEYIKVALTDYYNETNNTVKLKKPYYTTIQQESIEQEADEQEGVPINQTPPEPPTLEPDDMLIKITNWIKRFSRVVIVAILLLVVVLLIKPISLFLARLTESPRPYSIEFERKGRWLPYGEDMKLEVKPEPADASLEGLRCGSKGDNAHMIEVLSEQNLHIKAVKESEDSERCPVDIEAYMDYNENIKDVMTIYIIKDGQNESTGEGEIHDKFSGDYSQKAD